MTASCTLNWFSDRGFELDLDSVEDELTLRLVSVPVPADGTVELRADPVPLDRLEILFKAQVDIEGEPGQLQSATVQVVREKNRDLLTLSAQVEDVETGEIRDVEVRAAVTLPVGAPASGGPRPTPPDEDELDWEDETTLEKMIVSGPETSAPREPPSGGLTALLKALAALEDEEPEAVKPVEVAPEPSPEPEPDPEPDDLGDQRFTAEDEAKGLLQLLLDRDELELEDGFGIDDLVNGLVPVLQLPGSAEARAGRLSGWLLDQPAVGDLFIQDEDLAEILEHW